MHNSRRPTAVVAALLLIAVHGCSYFSYPVNPPLPRGTQSTDYRFTTVVPDDISEDGTFVILTLSGGGTRAAALAYGVMQELDHYRIQGGAKSLLDEVDVISSVSGGSFAAAYYGLFGKEQFLTNFKADVLNRPIQRNLILTALAPWNWPRLLSPYFGRSDLAAEYYDTHIFRGRTFGEMPRRRPFIVLNATDMTLGAQFTFTQDDFDKICSDLSSVKVARAVTASSAFPGGFSPLTINNYSKKDCSYASPAWFRGAAADIDNLPSRYDKYATEKEYERDDRPYLHLFDGGLSDNIGLRGAIFALSGTESTWRIWDKIEGHEVSHIKRIVVIIVDAKPRGEPELDRSACPPGLISVITASGTNPMENYSADSIDLLEAKFYEQRRMSEVWKDSRSRCRQFAEQQCRLHRQRDTCEPKFLEECYRQFGVVEDEKVPDLDLYRIYVRFPAADDAVRDRLNAISTSLQLNPGEVELLIQQGAQLIHTTGAFNDLIKDLDMRRQR